MKTFILGYPVTCLCHWVCKFDAYFIKVVVLNKGVVALMTYQRK